MGEQLAGEGKWTWFDHISNVSSGLQIPTGDALARGVEKDHAIRGSLGSARVPEASGCFELDEFGFGERLDLFDVVLVLAKQVVPTPTPLQQTDRSGGGKAVSR